MKVSVLRAVDMAEPALPIDHMHEEGEKLRAITIVRHDILPSIASTGDIVDGSGEINKRGSGHTPSAGD